MCVILSITQLKTNSKIQQDIVENIEGLKWYNKDGYGYVADNPNKNDFTCRREMTCSSHRLWNTLLRYQMVNIHLRLATAGVVAQKNVHWWQKGDWFFAHNGAVSDYIDISKKSDSYHFFEALTNFNYIGENGKIMPDKISQLKDETNFWGRLVLYNKRLKKNWFFGDFHLYNLANEVLVVATQELDFNEKSVLCGIEFSGYPSFKVAHQEIEGIFSLTVKNKRFTMFSDKFGSGTTYSNSNNGWKSYSETDKFIPAGKIGSGEVELLANVIAKDENEYCEVTDRPISDYDDGYWDSKEKKWYTLAECIDSVDRQIKYDTYHAQRTKFLH